MITRSHDKYDDIAARYGVKYEGTLVGPEYHEQVDYADQMTLAQVSKAGGKITRLRLLQEGGRVDCSYCHATLPDGKIVPVYVTGNLHGVWRSEVKGELINWAKEQGVFAKGLGLLDESNWSVLH